MSVTSVDENEHRSSESLTTCLAFCDSNIFHVKDWKAFSEALDGYPFAIDEDELDIDTPSGTGAFVQLRAVEGEESGEWPRSNNNKDEIDPYFSQLIQSHLSPGATCVLQDSYVESTESNDHIVDYFLCLIPADGAIRSVGSESLMKSMNNGQYPSGGTGHIDVSDDAVPQT